MSSHLSSTNWQDTWAMLRSAGGLTPRNAFVSAVLVVVTAIFESVGVAMVLPLLDFIAKDGNLSALQQGSRLWDHLISFFDMVGVRVNLLNLTIIVFALIVARQVTQFAASLYQGWLLYKTEMALQDTVTGAIFSSRLLACSELASGSVVDLLNVQCRSGAGLVRQYLTLWGLVVTFAAYGVVLFITAPLPSLAAVGLMALGVLSVEHYVKQTRRLGQQLVIAQQGIGSWISERLTGLRLIKLSNTANRETASARHQTQELCKLQVSIARSDALAQFVLTLLLIAMVLGALYVSVEILQITVSVVTLFTMVALRLLPIAFGLAKLKQGVTTQTASLMRVKDVIAPMLAAPERDSGDRTFQGIKSSIEFSNVVYSYPGKFSPTLRGLHANLPAGKVTAIIGPSGAGKSTLVDLIPRLLDVDSGQICFDGVSCEHFTLKSLRHGIAYMPQHVTLFDDTVINNVRYAQFDAPEEAVVEACKLAHADEFIRAMPDGYNSRLGEAGLRLSGGQRQRLSLARVFLSKAGIIILDEPSSAMDFQSENFIQQALSNYIAKSGATLVVIAHRLSTIRMAQHIVVLRNGIVVQSGSPQELRHADDWYQAMLENDNHPAAH